MTAGGHCQFTADDALADLCHCYPQAAGLLADLDADLLTTGLRVAEAVDLLQAGGTAVTIEELLEELALGVRWPDDHDEVDLEDWDLGELIDHIEYCHHRRMRSELARLRCLTTGPAGRAAGLEALAGQVSDLSRLIEDHLCEEETELFPIGRQLDGGGVAFEEGDRLARHIGHDHRDLASACADLVRTVEGKCFEDKVLQSAIQTLVSDLVADLQVHSTEEDGLLIPDLLHRLEVGRRRPPPS